MVNRELRQALLTKLKVTAQRVSQRASALKQDVPMSTEDAWYVLAALQGIDVSRFLSTEDVDRTRELLAHVKKPATANDNAPRRTRAKATPRGTVTIVIAPDVAISDPLVSAVVADEARMMSERVYPLAYILENSMRAFISRILTGVYGKEWWDASVPAAIKDAVAGRMKEEKRTYWHGKRGAHPIYYTDTDHLRRIVETNWKAFEDYLPRKGFFTERLSEINVSRRVIAHNNPLSADDRKRLEVYFKDWQKHVSGIASSLPKTLTS